MYSTMDAIDPILTIYRTGRKIRIDSSYCLKVIGSQSVMQLVQIVGLSPPLALPFITGYISSTNGTLNQTNYLDVG
jgi:hypothetical protein